MSHAIIIMREKIDCLQGQNVTGAGQLETLWTNIQSADAEINSTTVSKERSDELHEWLHEVQDELTAACSSFSTLNSNCP